MDWTNLATLFIPIAVPLIIAGLKWATTKIPSKLLPILAPIIGALLDVGLAVATGHAANPVVGAILGSAGVGVREIKDQLFPAPKTS